MRQSVEEIMEGSLLDKANQRFTIPVGGIPEEEVDEFMRKQVEKMQETFDNASIYKESLNFTKDIVGLTRNQSNDMELGAAIRQYVNNNVK